MGGVACPAVAYLHQRAAVLEPELDLARLQAQAPAQVGALLVVRVGALLEQPAQTTPTRSRGAPRTRVRRNESALTLRAAGSGAACGGGSASSACAGSRCRPRRRRRRQRRRRPGGRWPSGCRSPPPPRRPWRRRRAPPTNPFARRCRRGPPAITHERAAHSRITLESQPSSRRAGIGSRLGCSLPFCRLPCLDPHESPRTHQQVTAKTTTVFSS
jgi:hypothetical protein